MQHGDLEGSRGPTEPPAQTHVSFWGAAPDTREGACVNVREASTIKI